VRAVAHARAYPEPIARARARRGTDPAATPAAARVPRRAYVAARAWATPRPDRDAPPARGGGLHERPAGRRARRVRGARRAARRVSNGRADAVPHRSLR